MKSLFSYCLLITGITIAPFTSYAQPGAPANYIRTIDVLSPGITTAEQVEDAGLLQRSTKYVFFDGLGRPIQEVIANGSPTEQDIVQPFAYDARGLQTVKYLPYTSGSEGWFKDDFLTIEDANYHTLSNPQYKFYQTTPKIPIDQQPYAVTVLESSPLNRVLKQGAPGTAWQPDESDFSNLTDHTIAYDFEANEENEVLHWTYSPPVTPGSSGALSTEAAYSPNQLYKMRTRDEEHNEIIEYTDKEGRVVLKRVEAPNNEWADTYYIYDDFGNLVIVLPPEAVKALTGN